MDLEDMMAAEGIETLKLDKASNALTVLDRSDDNVKVSISMDLIRAFEKRAEESGKEVFRVVEGE